MLTPRELLQRLLDRLQRERLAAEMEEEMRHHRQLLERDLRAAGHDDQHLRAAVRRTFGNETRHLEATRDMWTFRWFESVQQDLRYAVRSLRRAPAFTAVVLVTLALGIGANTAVFSVVDAVLLRPLPYPRADRLVAIWPGHFVGGAELDYVQRHARSYERGAAFFSPGWGMVLTQPDGATQLSAARTSTNFFDVIGVAPLVGRTFVAGESAPGATGVAVLSHALWQSAFGCDSSIIGRAATIEGSPVTVVGVMPGDFSILQADAQLWMPYEIDPASPFYRGASGFLVGRLATGADPSSAARELRQLAPEIRRAFDFDAAYGHDITVVPLRDYIVGPVRTTLWVLLAAVTLLVLIACANVANLLVARAGRRRQEIAMRTALGASRGRIVRQMLVESLLLAALGGAIGAATGAMALMAFKGILPATLPRLEHIAVDHRVLGLTAFVALGIGVAFGIAPALVASRGSSDLRAAHGADRGALGRRLRGGLVVGEVALALILVIGAGLMSATLWQLSRVDTGFRTDHVLTLRVQPTPPAYETRAQREQYLDRVLAAVRSVPGVQSAGAIQHLPLSGFNWHRDLELEGRPVPKGAKPWNAGYRNVAGDYFAVMRIPLRSGRLFEASDDTAHAPVVIVNETFARTFFPGEAPVGKRIQPQRMGWRTIVGVVGDVRHASVTTPPEPEFFIWSGQVLQSQMQVVIRTAGDPMAVARTVFTRVAEIDRMVPVSNLQSLDAHASASIAQPRVAMMLLLAFALVGLALGAVGIYGVIAYTVAARGHEFGIRLALGARRRDVTAMVVREGVRQAGVGVLIGLVAALVLSRFVRAMLFEVSATDVPTYASVAAVLLLVAAVASWIPARRAAREDPMRALRAE